MPISPPMDPLCVAKELETMDTAITEAKREECLRQMAALLLSSLPEKYAEIYTWIQVAANVSE